MRRRNMRVADLARRLETPYTTVREWVLHGREPMRVLSSTHEAEYTWLMEQLKALEK